MHKIDKDNKKIEINQIRKISASIYSLRKREPLTRAVWRADLSRVAGIHCFPRVLILSSRGSTFEPINFSSL